nr:MAG TPA: hypothetical protein [Caudoviricetes sp.]
MNAYKNVYSLYKCITSNKKSDYLLVAILQLL